jgi:uncharacterized protein with PQ loop repeat
MTLIDKSIYYYLIMFATFLICFSFVPLIFEILQEKITSNIPYATLICFVVALLIYLFITISREYFIHSILYSIALACSIIILFLKRKYDKNNTNISVVKYELS